MTLLKLEGPLQNLEELLCGFAIELNSLTFLAWKRSRIATVCIDLYE